MPQFAAQDFTLLQPSEYLVRNVPFDQVEHVVDAVMPSAEQAALLEMPATEPCLLLTRRTWSRGVPITVVRCLHPASRYRLGSRFSGGWEPGSGLNDPPKPIRFPLSNLFFADTNLYIQDETYDHLHTFCLPSSAAITWCRAPSAWQNCAASTQAA